MALSGVHWAGYPSDTRQWLKPLFGADAELDGALRAFDGPSPNR